MIGLAQVRQYGNSAMEVLEGASNKAADGLEYVGNKVNALANGFRVKKVNHTTVALVTLAAVVTAAVLIGGQVAAMSAVYAGLQAGGYTTLQHMALLTASTVLADAALLLLVKLALKI